MSASRIPWYLWLTIALALFLAGLAGVRDLNTAPHTGFGTDFPLLIFVFAAWFFALVFGIVGFIRLVKWASKD